ncbi:indole-3-glycerol phosphate synthase TrpC [Candidatus Woesearchaeota archaeon]|nr:indole-3-glycerol phosphate synthase TrpC [Candidatus Woesearchaeota archaeon]
MKKNILERIVENKKKELKYRKKEFPLEKLKVRIRKKNNKNFFKSALKRKNVSLIAELKRKSPSLGLIKQDFDHTKIAQKYEESGADAISVLTDKKFFQGNIEFIEDIKNRINIPILRKDFIIDSYQVYESKAFGADAILLIAAILPLNKLKELKQVADELNLDCLIEVNSYSEIEAAIDAGAEIIGINNRDLKTMEIDINTFENLSRHIPEEIVKVSESGIFSRSDVLKVKLAGADAVLVGTSLMTSKNIEKKIRELKI